ncbi:Mannan polymerase complex subunit MNN9 [Fusarium oxysporum f. sp. albedinis]|nr:Mannan polymerase complex subunit MNN9 [Fusarium oxysporum f. sp. albedinis]
MRGLCVGHRIGQADTGDNDKVADNLDQAIKVVIRRKIAKLDDPLDNTTIQSHNIVRIRGYFYPYTSFSHCSRES